MSDRGAIFSFGSGRPPLYLVLPRTITVLPLPPRCMSGSDAVSDRGAIFFFGSGQPAKGHPTVTSLLRYLSGLDTRFCIRRCPTATPLPVLQVLTLCLTEVQSFSSVRVNLPFTSCYPVPLPSYHYPPAVCQVLTLCLTEVQSFSSVRVNLPKDIRTADARFSVMKILKEVERRFGEGVPTLQVSKT